MVDVNAYITTRHLLNKYILPIFWSYQFNSIHVNTYLFNATKQTQNKHKTNTKQTQNKNKHIIFSYLLKSCFIMKTLKW